MKSLYRRSQFKDQLGQVFANLSALRAHLPASDLPEALVQWLTDLGNLHGVPFNYLVPDEGMLPPESIRFFYLDPNWIAALTDGALSIGRNLDPNPESPEMNLQKALHPTLRGQVLSNAFTNRRRAFGLPHRENSGAEPGAPAVISGFVLRSSLVREYPSLGVNVYPEGHTPNDPEPELLDILRFEQLGKSSDTLVCLVSGDAYRVDLHEAPQALHYGIDCFEADCQVGTNPVTAVKNLYTFGNKTENVDGVTTNSVTMSQTVTPTDISDCFRSKESRVIGMDAVAQKILAVNKNATPPAGTTAPTTIDSAELGFEMIQGVGMVSFIQSANS
ncbi:MAG: hypothetical protein AAGN35_00095 [Bacteroidota bacterium]